MIKNTFQKVYRRIILEEFNPILKQQRKLLPVTLAQDYTDCDFGGDYIEIIDGKYGVVYNAHIKQVMQTLKNQNDTFMLNQFKKYYKDGAHGRLFFYGNRKWKNIQFSNQRPIGSLFDINQNKLIAFIDLQYFNYLQDKYGIKNELNLTDGIVALAKGFTISSNLIQTFIHILSEHQEQEFSDEKRNYYKNYENNENQLLKKRRSNNKNRFNKLHKHINRIHELENEQFFTWCDTHDFYGKFVNKDQYDAFKLNDKDYEFYKNLDYQHRVLLIYDHNIPLLSIQMDPSGHQENLGRPQVTGSDGYEIAYMDDLTDECKKALIELVKANVFPEKMLLPDKPDDYNQYSIGLLWEVNKLLNYSNLTKKSRFDLMQKIGQSEHYLAYKCSYQLLFLTEDVNDGDETWLTNDGQWFNHGDIICLVDKSTYNIIWSCDQFWFDKTIKYNPMYVVGGQIDEEGKSLLGIEEIID